MDSPAADGVSGQSPVGHCGGPADAADGRVGDAGPRWLTPEELRAWFALASLSMRLPTVLDARMQRDAGLTFFEYLTMARLSEQPGRTLTMSAVAVMATSSLPRLSHVVRRLEERGWVDRRPSPDDRRTTLVTLTDAGFAVVERAAGPHVEFVRELVFDQLTAAQTGQLARIGDRLMPALWPEGVPRPTAGQD